MRTVICRSQPAKHCGSRSWSSLVIAWMNTSWASSCASTASRSRASAIAKTAGWKRVTSSPYAARSPARARSTKGKTSFQVMVPSPVSIPPHCGDTTPSGRSPPRIKSRERGHRR